MGILNVTPDSFSDGGQWNNKDDAVKHAFEMIDQGASIIDIGAESTRPGCQPVSAEEEWNRLQPILEALLPSIDVPVSIDTMKTETAFKCISVGVDIINDVNGFRAEGMFEACSGSDVGIVISHMYGDYGRMHDATMGPDFKEEIASFLKDQAAKAERCGISHDMIIVDPGLGFGKTPEQNMAIVKDCSFLGHEYPILIGASRKRFVRHYYPDMDADQASAMVARIAIDSGADIVRVHNVGSMISALKS